MYSSIGWFILSFFFVFSRVCTHKKGENNQKKQKLTKKRHQNRKKQSQQNDKKIEEIETKEREKKKMTKNKWTTNKLFIFIENVAQDGSFFLVFYFDVVVVVSFVVIEKSSLGIYI